MKTWNHMTESTLLVKAVVRDAAMCAKPSAASAFGGAAPGHPRVNVGGYLLGAVTSSASCCARVPHMVNVRRQRVIVVEVVTLFRPVGQKELDLIAASGWTAFPPRLDWQPIFYPVLNEEYAVQIARDWNTKDSASDNVGYVTRFAVNAAFVAKYKPEVVGSAVHRELWVPAEELDEFNRNIVGTIEVIHEFKPPRS